MKVFRLPNNVTLSRVYEVEDSLNRQIDIQRANKLIHSVLSTLTPRQESVVTSRFGLDSNIPLTLREVSQFYHVSEGRIQQILTRALRVLSHPTRSGKLKSFLYLCNVGVKDTKKHRKVGPNPNYMYKKTD